MLISGILAVFLLLNFSLPSQIYLASAGASAGLGNFSGLSTGQTGFLLMPSVEAGFIGSPGYLLSASYISIRNTGILIPEDRTGKYYGSVSGILAELQIRQFITRSLYIQGSGGIAYLLDKSSPDISSWSAGLSFGAVAGIDLKQAGLSRGSFRITAGLSSAFTLQNTFPGYQAAVIGFFIPLAD